MSDASSALGVADLFVRGAAASALFVFGAALLRSGAGQSVKIAGGLFVGSVIAYVINSSSSIAPHLGATAPLIDFLTHGGVGFFWLFCATLFQDARLGLHTMWPVAVLLVLGAVAASMASHEARVIWALHNGLAIALTGHALWDVFRGGTGDLVEGRRSLRGPFMAAVGCYIALLSLGELAKLFGLELPSFALLTALATCLLSLAAAVLFAEMGPALFALRPSLLAAPSAMPTSEPFDAAPLARLTDAMTEKEVWRDEHLTVAILARHVGVAEYRLRQYINGALGYRNFAQFVNEHRIAAAKAALHDPARARQTIGTIAFEIGFGSLAAFNRAFKDATGLTPSQWRHTSPSAD